MKRSIFDLRPPSPEKVDDLHAFVTQFGVARLLFPHNRGVAAEAALNREIAQFIAMRACLRMPMP